MLGIFTKCNSFFFLLRLFHAARLGRRTLLNQHLIQLARYAPLFFWLALEGIGKSEGVRCAVLRPLSKSVATLQEADSSAERDKEGAITEESGVVGADTTALQDAYWKPPPVNSYTRS